MDAIILVMLLVFVSAFPAGAPLSFAAMKPDGTCPDSSLSDQACGEAGSGDLINPAKTPLIIVPVPPDGKPGAGDTSGPQTPARAEEPKRAKESAPVADRSRKPFVVHFFWGKGCPHCADEKPFLDEMKKKFPGMTVKSHEVWYDKEKALLLSEMAKSYGLQNTGVPVTFFGEYAIVGFNERSKEQLRSYFETCARTECIDPLDRMDLLRRLQSGQGTTDSGAVTGPQGDRDAGRGSAPAGSEIADEIIDVPFIGRVDAAKMSLPVMTVVIAGLDSFNPCAFFVLFSLLGLLVHARSRGKMFLIGAVFVFFSGFIYFLFMSAWLNLFLFMGHVAFITTIAGAVSIAIAAVNMKDFFAFGKGVSLTIPDSAKPKLFDKMRKLMRSTSTPSILFGTGVLAVAANSYELLCTAGFPMVFTRILTLNELSPVSYYLYLVLYNIVYIVPLSFIVAIFTVTLGRKKLTEWQGRVLKLLSGTMMLGLGAVLIFNPALLNNVLISLALLAGALIVSSVIILVSRRLGHAETS